MNCPGSGPGPVDRLPGRYRPSRRLSLTAPVSIARVWLSGSAAENFITSNLCGSCRWFLRLFRENDKRIKCDVIIQWPVTATMRNKRKRMRVMGTVREARLNASIDWLVAQHRKCNGLYWFKLVRNRWYPPLKLIMALSFMSCRSRAATNCRKGNMHNC